MTLIEQLTQMRGLIDAQKTASLLGMHKDKLYKEAKAGEIPHFRILGRVKFDPQVLAEWLKQREFK